MMKPIHLLLWLAAGIVVLLASDARAGSADPLTLRDQLEDQWLDGDKDIEDLAVFHLAGGSDANRRGPATYLALEGFAGRVASGQRDIGALLVLQLPFERLWPRTHSIASPFGERRGALSARPTLVSAGLDARAGFVAETALLGQPGDEAPSVREVPAGSTAIADPNGRAQGPTPGRAALIVVDTAVTRACVGAALRAVGLSDDARLDSMAARSRSSALLPELRLRAMRTIDQSGRVTLSEVDPSRYVEAGTATDWLEARMTFRLDRLLFADDEVSLERIRIDRSELRSRLTARVLEALFEWQRAYALVADPGLAEAEHFSAVLRELEAAARLDVMTDGWFGRFRAGIKGPI